MNTLDLHRFIEESGAETSNDGKSAIIWVYAFCLDDFCKLFEDSDYLQNNGINVRLQQDAVAVDIKDVCEYFDIDVNELIAIN